MHQPSPHPLPLLVLAAAASCAVGYFTADRTQYCALTVNHALCGDTGRGPACGGYLLASGVPPDDVTTILHEHNSLRARLATGSEQQGRPGPQPAAADMMMLEWDEELAAVAQAHANQCVFDHDCNKCRRVRRFEVGQNLFLSTANQFVASSRWAQVVRGWYSEVKDFDRSHAANHRFSHATGHYTQLVWGQTTRVGCGFAMYEDNRWYKKLYTCNYGPAGNFISVPMYRLGPPCSKCPGSLCSQLYYGLCEQTFENDPSLNHIDFWVSSNYQSQPGYLGVESNYNLVNVDDTYSYSPFQSASNTKNLFLWRVPQ